MRTQRSPDSAARLETKRQEINAALRSMEGQVHEPKKKTSSHVDTGPWYSFASVGNVYGQNATGYWDAHGRRAK